MKIDYPELEGKEFDYIDSNGHKHRAKVVGVNYYAGITAVSIKDPKLKLICLNAKNHRGTDSFWTKSRYRKRFHQHIAGIKSGTYQILPASGAAFINQNCAFV